MRPLMSKSQFLLLSQGAELALANPFRQQRIELEREILGKQFEERSLSWEWGQTSAAVRNARAITEKIAKALEEVSRDSAGSLLRDRLPDPKDVYTRLRNAASMVCYFEMSDGLDELLRGDTTRRGCATQLFERCSQRFASLLNVQAGGREVREALAQEFALFVQIRRAVLAIQTQFIGNSRALAGLRASLWESIFTHDMARYLRCLHGRMHEFSSLITGESGTGKELAARTIAGCRFVPYDAAAGCFPVDPLSEFHPVNLAALPPTLIESELFGHAKGSFTGASAERRGWLEIGSQTASVFLDEIGDLDPGIQVKLLRVLQSRTFQRVGDWKSRRFEGKIIAATNRSLDDAVAGGTFREDLYYRLCSDLVRTPSLRDQLRDSPDALAPIAKWFAQQLVGADESALLAEEALEWIRRSLPADYAWPGNVRELEQLVRNVLIRRNYRGLQPAARPGGDALDAFFGAFRRGELTLDQVQREYCRLVHRQTNNWQESARRLGVDHRTVKAHFGADDH